MLKGFRSSLPLVIACMASMPTAFAADVVMTATFDGKPWTASFSQGTTLEMAGKPVLNLSGTEQGSPTMTFNSMLVLKAEGDFVGTYAFKGGFPANSANFNVLDSGAMVAHVRFNSSEVVIDSYDAAAKTVSGHFSVSGKDDSGKPEAITDGNFSGVPVSPQ